MTGKELDQEFEDLKVHLHYNVLQLSYKYSPSELGPSANLINFDDFKSKKMSGHLNRVTYLECWKNRNPHLIDPSHRFYGKKHWGWYN